MTSDAECQRAEEALRGGGRESVLRCLRRCAATNDPEWSPRARMNLASLGLAGPGTTVVVVDESVDVSTGIAAAPGERVRRQFAIGNP